MPDQEANEYDENEGCRANIRTGQRCIKDETDKIWSNEVDTESANTDPEMFDQHCNRTSEKPLELNKQENDDDDDELSLPTVASASHSSDIVGVLVALQRHELVIRGAQETIEHESAILAGWWLLSTSCKI